MEVNVNKGIPYIKEYLDAHALRVTTSDYEISYNKNGISYVIPNNNGNNKMRIVSDLPDTQKRISKLEEEAEVSFYK